MAVTTNTATKRSTSGQAAGFGEGAGIHHLTATVELAASDSSSTITFGDIPANARIMGSSRVYWDDLASSGSPTLDIGLFAVGGNITSDDDCLNDGLALSSVSTANVGSQVVKDIANFGKRAWEYVNGQTTAVNGLLTVKGTVRDAATTATGTVTLQLHYALE